MRVTFAVALLAGILITRPVSAQSTKACQLQTGWIKLESGAEGLTVPAELNSKRIFALLDSGAPASLIDSRHSTAAKAVLSQNESASAFGGKIRIGKLEELKVTIGDRDLVFPTIGLIDLSSLDRASQPVGMIIGRDILASCAVQIDADRHRFRVHDSPVETEASPDHTRVRISYNHGVPRVPIEIGRGNVIPAVIDTGSAGALGLDGRTWNAVRPKGTRETSVISGGLGGLVVEGLAVIPAMMIGGVPFGDVEVRIDLDGQNADRNQLGAAVIGLELLQKANVLIDFARNELSFGAKAASVQKTEKSTSGVIAVVDAKSLRILHVMAGSPASEIGLVVNDRICLVDGNAVKLDYEDSSMRSWTRDVPGRVVSLRLCDGRSKKLTLREFY